MLFEAGVGHRARRSEVAGSRTNLSDAYVAVGATSVRVDDASGFAAGDTVVERAPSAEWIASIGMDAIADCDDGGGCYDWDPADYALSWERTVVGVDGATVELDFPVVHPIQVRETDQGRDVFYFPDRLKPRVSCVPLDPIS